jgi:polyhydroxyalkanoate synthesis regulator phasin
MNNNTMSEGQARSSTPGGSIDNAEGMGKRIFLAGIGAAALACDTAAETFDRLVERGGRVNEEMRQNADRMRRESPINRSRASDFVRSTMDSVLNAANLPSKSDVDTIHVKLNVLTRKLDDLEMERVRTAGPATDVPSTEAHVSIDEELGT